MKCESNNFSRRHNARSALTVGNAVHTGHRRRPRAKDHRLRLPTTRTNRRHTTLYRENGQFKTSYRADQQIFPIAQDRIAIGLILAVAFLVVPAFASG